MQLEGLKKQEHKQKTLNMIQAFQNKTNKDPSEFLEKMYQAYKKHIDADPQATENVRVVNTTFIWQNAPDI